MRGGQLQQTVVFGRAFKYGIVVWQCRHADINTFIQRVLANARPLVEAGIVDGFVFAAFGPDGRVKDEVQLCLRTGSSNSGGDIAQPRTAQELMQCDADFKMCVLRLLVQLENMPPLSPETDTWTVQCQTRTGAALAAGAAATTAAQSAVLEQALQSQEWVVAEEGVGTGAAPSPSPGRAPTISPVAAASNSVFEMIGVNWRKFN